MANRHIFVWIIVFLCLMNVVFAVDVSSCRDINSPGTYDVVADISDNLAINVECIHIESSNIIFDCKGHVVDVGNGLFLLGGYVAPINNVTIRNCNVTDSGQGIRIFEGDNILIENNDIYALRELVNQHTVAIESKTGENVSIVSNYIHDTSGATNNGSYGIGLRNVKNGSIRNNRIERIENTLPRGWPISVSGGSNSFVEDNNMSYFDHTGIIIDNTLNSTVRNNRIERFGFRAITSLYDTNVSFITNYIYKPVGQWGLGFFSLGAINSIIENNTIALWQPVAEGIEVRSGSDVMVRGNDFSSSSLKYYIYIELSDEVIIDNDVQKILLNNTNNSIVMDSIVSQEIEIRNISNNNMINNTNIVSFILNTPGTSSNKLVDSRLTNYNLLRGMLNVGNSTYGTVDFRESLDSSGLQAGQIVDFIQSQATLNIGSLASADILLKNVPVIANNPLVFADGIECENCTYDTASVVGDVSFLTAGGHAVYNIQSACGNSILNANEQCDDGNTVNDDFCGTDCERRFSGLSCGWTDCLVTCGAGYQCVEGNICAKEINGCQDLNVQSEYYVLTQSILNHGATCFTVSENNITLNLGGFTVDGDRIGSDYGIYMDGYDNVVIKNGLISDFSVLLGIRNSEGNKVNNLDLVNGTSQGVWVLSSTNLSIREVYLNDNVARGIFLDDVSDSEITDIEIRGTVGTSHPGMQLSGSSNNAITGLKVFDTTWMGVLLSNSPLNTFENCIIEPDSVVGFKMESGSTSNTFTNTRACGGSTDFSCANFNHGHTSSGLTCDDENCGGIICSSTC